STRSTSGSMGEPLAMARIVGNCECNRFRIHALVLAVWFTCRSSTGSREPRRARRERANLRCPRNGKRSGRGIIPRPAGPSSQSHWGRLKQRPWEGDGTFFRQPGYRPTRWPVRASVRAGSPNAPAGKPGRALATQAFMTTTVQTLRARACLLAGLASLSTFPIAAQTLPETRVSATRFSEPAANLPLGVSVITADQIRAAGATTVNDAIVRLLGVPGRLDLANGNDTSIDLRGFGATADANQVVIVDGLRLSEGDLSAPRLAGIPIESVERIEVLRGSGAVLYGEG